MFSAVLAFIVLLSVTSCYLLLSEAVEKGRRQHQELASVVVHQPQPFCPHIQITTFTSLGISKTNLVSFTDEFRPSYSFSV